MKARVASIYFCERRVDRPLYGGRFILPKIPKGGDPVILDVNDHYQPEKQPYTVGGGIIRRVITGQEIAEDIVQTLAHNTPGFEGVIGGTTPDCGPGIWHVRDYKPQVTVNTLPNGSTVEVIQKDMDGRVVLEPLTEDERLSAWKEDLEKAVERQNAWANTLIAMGDYLESRVPTRAGQITAEMKEAVGFMGRKRAWTLNVRAGDVRNCPFCQEPIGYYVSKCPHCQEVIDKKLFQSRQKQAGYPEEVKPEAFQIQEPPVMQT